MIIFVYCLLDPIDGNCRYIGISNNPTRRFNEHIIYNQKNPHKYKWIQSLLKKSEKPILKILEKANEHNWKEREQWWIRYFKKKNQNLTNLTLGGDGTFGIVCSEEKKKKISQSLMGHNISEETRQKMSEIAKKRIKEKGHHMLGKKHSLESLIKMSNSRKGYIMPEEQKKKISESHKNNSLIQKKPHITFKIILERAKKNNFKLRQLARYFECDKGTIIQKIRKEGFQNWKHFSENYK